MFNTEDDDVDAGLGATAYNVMPSLVALQQMRNRLHLAYLGKKLMKWTALATGKELRKIALEMAESYQNYASDMKDAFLLLARARFFTPALNSIVIENVPRIASCTVHVTTKTMSGVKVASLCFQNSEFDPYLHLGIGTGGRAVYEAKHAWLALLKLMVHMVQLRTAFLQIEIANKNATKKQNVLSGVIIPKIKATIRYIGYELEEVEREETFRLKRFKQLKYKVAEAAKAAAPKKKDEDAEEEIAHMNVCGCCMAVFETEGEGEQFICPLCQLEAKAKEDKHELKVNIIPCQKIISKTSQNKERLEHLMSHINEVIVLAEQYKSDGIVSPSMEEFIKTCGTVKEKIEDYSNYPCEVCQAQLLTPSSSTPCVCESEKSVEKPRTSPPSPPCVCESEKALEKPLTPPPLTPCSCKYEKSVEKPLKSSSLTPCVCGSEKALEKPRTPPPLTPCVCESKKALEKPRTLPSSTPWVRESEKSLVKSATPSPSTPWVRESEKSLVKSLTPSPSTPWVRESEKSLVKSVITSPSTPWVRESEKSLVKSVTTSPSTPWVRESEKSLVKPLTKPSSTQWVRESEKSLVKSLTPSPLTPCVCDSKKSLVKPLTKPSSTLWVRESEKSLVKSVIPSPSTPCVCDSKKSLVKKISENKHVQPCQPLSAHSSPCQPLSAHSSPCPATKQPSKVPAMPSEDQSDTFKLSLEMEPKLGYFEKKYKEIVKVTRLKNPDGTISVEKHIITIKTERRNPRNSENAEISIKNSVGPYSGGNRKDGGEVQSFGSLKSYSSKKSGKGKKSDCTTPDSQVCGSAATLCTNCKNYALKAPRSEAVNQSLPMCELKLRPTMSAGYQNTGMTSNTSMEINETCLFSETPKKQSSLDNVITIQANVHEATSVDMCFSKRSECMHGSDKPPKVVTICKSVQTCCTTPDNKPTADKATNCIPNCGATMNQRNSKKTKDKCYSTDSLQKKVPEQSPSLTPCDPADYTIKIISSAPLNQKDDNSEIILKTIVLSPSKSTQCNIIKLDIKHFCPHCYTKLTTATSPSSKTLVCFTCQPKSEVEKEEEFLSEFCSTCGTLGKFSTASGSYSCNGAKAGSLASDGSCLSASFSFHCTGKCLYKETYSLTETLKSPCSGCTKGKGSSEFFYPKIKVWTRPKQCCDAMTSTKRSDKFEPKSLGPSKGAHACKKIRSESCACHSNSHMLRNKEDNSPSLSESQLCGTDKYY